MSGPTINNQQWSAAMDKKKPLKGRPTKYTSTLAEEICTVISSSSQGIKVLCQEHPHWPNKDTIFTWLRDNKDFSDQYARAKQVQIECVVDELLEIADDDSGDRVLGTDGQVHFNSQAIQRARLRIDTRKWLACKLVPKVYGSLKSDNVPNLSIVERLIRDLDESLV